MIDLKIFLNACIPMLYLSASVPGEGNRLQRCRSVILRAIPRGRPMLVHLFRNDCFRVGNNRDFFPLLWDQNYQVSHHESTFSPS
jgi:hypothetical protein